MERIGLAASKIAKGNLALYNFYVVLISVLFSFFIFIISGSTVVFSIVVLAYVSREVSNLRFDANWTSVLLVCFISLTIIMVLFNLVAISKNIKLKK